MLSAATITTTNVLPDWIRAASPLVCDVVVEGSSSDAAAVPPDGAPVCAADDPDVEKVYRALAYWCIDFSAAPPGFVDSWFELPSAQRAQLVDTVRAFCRELHPNTCLDSAAERDDPVTFAAIVRAAEREGGGEYSSSRRYRLRSDDAAAASSSSSTITPAVAILAKFGAMQCLAAALGKDGDDDDNRYQPFSTAAQRERQKQQNRAQELWFGEALDGGCIDAVHFLINRFSRLRSLTLFHWEATFWIDYSAMRSGNTAMLDWLYIDCTRPMMMGRMWEAACAATINAPPDRFNALIAWIETRANRTYRAYFLGGVEVTDDGWLAPIRTDNVAALDYLEQHCDWNAADELANDDHALWITATDTAAAPACGGQEYYRPRATLVWLVARARAAGVRLLNGYDNMASHGGLAAMRWLRAQNVADWWPSTNQLRTFDAYTGAIRTKVPHATATSIIEMIDWLRSEGCPLQFFRTVHTFDPIFAALTTTNLKKVPSSLLCTLLDHLLLATAAAPMPLEYARSLAVHVFQGCCARTGYRPAAILDWICRQCPRLLVALQTDPMVQNMAAVQCVRCCNLVAAQWLLDVARVPPKAFNSKDMFHSSSAAEYPYWCKYAVANKRATLRWIEKVGGVASVESALVSAMEAAGNKVTSPVIRWLMKLLRPGAAAAVMSTPRMGRAALVDSNLLMLRHVMRWQKKRGECTAWRAPLLLARLAGRYARPALLCWLYGRRATQRDFGVEWRPEALVVAAEHDRLAAVRWMLRAKYSLRTKRNPTQILAAQELCLLLQNAMLDEAEACRPLLRQWMCRFFGWTDAEAEERVLGGGGN